MPKERKITGNAKDPRNLLIVPKSDIEVKKNRKDEIVGYAENPFLNGTSFRTRKRKVTIRKGLEIVNAETDERESAIEMVEIKHVDPDGFVKIYFSKIREIFSLSKIGLLVFEVILANIKRTPGRDEVMLSYEIIRRYFEGNDVPPFSKASYHRAISDMIKKDFLAPTLIRCVYYINPLYFFNGDRIRFVEEIVKKKKDAADLAESREIGDLKPIQDYPDLEDELDRIDERSIANKANVDAHVADDTAARKRSAVRTATFQ